MKTAVEEDENSIPELHTHCDCTDGNLRRIVGRLQYGM
jgi:hypothetical protein